MGAANTQLVMIHGLFGTMSYFEPNKLLEGLSVHTPELLGYGPEAARGEQPLSLAAQARCVADYLERVVRQPAWVLGHSIGGAIAMLVAQMTPQLVAGLINVEGNFTLKDAFWCGRISQLAEEAWAAEFRGMQADPAGWLTDSEITPTPQRIEWARSLLQHQPASTIQAMARSVVIETGQPGYLESVKAVIQRGTPTHLLAGQRSAAGWDVPPWLRAAARSSRELEGVGHMMMLEAPHAFCAVVRAMIHHG